MPYEIKWDGYGDHMEEDAGCKLEKKLRRDLEAMLESLDVIL